jgi:hypothetical protein
MNFVSVFEFDDRLQKLKTISFKHHQQIDGMVSISA